MKEESNMIQIIAGKKGKGKTKYLLAGANEAVDAATGSIVYIDKNGKHMYELNNKVRLINVAEYPIRTYNAFVGFICGILSQDRDIEVIFLDSFLTMAHLEEAEDLTQNARYKCNEQRYGCHSGQYKRNLTTPSGNIIFKVSPHQQWEKESLIWRHGPAQRFPSRR